ncbi:EF-hand calcium-binding domain-containing protein 1 [Amphibalanus amphitrite]|uniref:EF-hand calcium-binding domain-containing protein 1 n=1 Tax=Amphibalanus amphitrite TaxID=1232801 RepID=A0A6A4VFX4_AMPAM|nr:EF-hand calcium-binding domain-containing protein 1-like [Amphibalanus amphitrite]XP_043242536.1 EF-hand calcium-binding domain-containing protein 1-like [Amphibalanus amphitrite]KAF0292049.1 EF-hand calcium-binding domain-containing protein 1 [Amphibalanus amphitrite]
MAQSGSKKTQNQVLDQLAKATHFNRNEIEALVLMFRKTLRPKTDKLDRSKFRDVLHNTFDMTDDMLMDRVFRVFDKDNDGLINMEEWVTGLSVFLRGTLQERINYCFAVYDFNGDQSLARDEVYHLLKNSVMKNPQEEDPEEGVRDLIDLVMKKLDVNHDGFVSFDDYEATVKMEPLLLEVFGPCLPQQESLETFLTTFVEPKRTPGYEG